MSPVDLGRTPHKISVYPNIQGSLGKVDMSTPFVHLWSGRRVTWYSCHMGKQVHPCKVFKSIQIDVL